MAAQLAVMIFLALFGGEKLDEYFNLKTPLFTIFLIVIFFTGFMISVYRDLNKPKDDSEDEA